MAILQLLYCVGAILFEGFEVNEGVDIEEILLQYWPDLCEQYRGVSPRKRIPGTKVSHTYIQAQTHTFTHSHTYTHT